MKKFVITFLLIILSIITFSKGVFINPAGPTLLPAAGLFSGEIKPTNDFELKIWKTPDEAIAMLVSGQADLALLPVSLGATLYNKKVPLKLVAVSTWKAFYLVGTSDDIKSLKDLKGKEVYTPFGPGQTGDVIMRYFFKKYGLEIGKDVFVKYANNPEIVALLSSGKINYALLPEPFVSLSLFKVKDSKILIDIQSEWAKETGLKKERIPISGIFVRNEFLENNPELFKDFIESYKKSLNWLFENENKATEYVSEVMGNFPVKVLQDALKNSHFEFIYAADCRDEIELYFKELSKVDPEAVGGVPNEDFFYLGDDD
ncbi:MAG: NitT/TauT family transport system substrate-binding protein [Thermotogaceae bacterium]|jgi:NitT/TauT family transport system substrate-binding protein|nr:NitT/TauT family transport system substrate-binding protein [Thermotogaceae bacterium]MDN5337640.1 NitT/TauT family transport system substrate-binding protein [Thermotogaceae bacterium]